jgi:hypothetical protein
MDSITVADFSRYLRLREDRRAREWRRARGLLSLRDLADDYRASHFVREPGLLAALPEDLREGQLCRS